MAENWQPSLSRDSSGEVSFPDNDQESSQRYNASMSASVPSPQLKCPSLLSRDSSPEPDSRLNGQEPNPHDNASDSVHALRTQQRWPWRVLWWPVIVVSVGFVVLALVCAFLIFLWFSDAQNDTWRAVISSSWTTRLITLSSLLIRWTISLQAVLCTSILAASIMASGVPLTDALQLSTVRHTNSGPWDILGLLAGNYRQWKPNLGAAALIPTLAGLTILCQFSSTLLLSDLDPASIPSGLYSYRSSLGFVNEALSDAFRRTQMIEPDAYLSGLPSYPTFAEISHPGQALDMAEVDDTGPSIRAFIPVSDNKLRENLLSFSGNVTLYDARVACVQPRLDNLSFERPGSGYYFFNLTGIARPVQRLGDMFVTDEDQAAWFRCTIPFWDAGYDHWLVSVCNIHSAAGGFLSSIDPMYNTSLTYFSNPRGDGWALRKPEDDASDLSEDRLPVGHAYLVLNTTYNAPMNISSADDPDTRDEYVPKVSTTEQDNHWLRIYPLLQPPEPGSLIDPIAPPPNQTRNLDWSIAATLCFEASAYTKNFFAEASRTQKSNEPATLEASLRQLGLPDATLPYKGRGILELSEDELTRQLDIERNILSKEDRYFPETPDPKVPDSEDPVQRPTANPVSNALYGCRSLKQGQDPSYDLNVSRFLFPFPLMVTYNTLSVSEERAELFQQALRSTNSPAKALQALFHTVMADGFYRYLPYYDVPSNYTVNYELSVLRPVRKTGLIIVLTALALHIFCVSIIAIFLSGILPANRPPLYASINNIWQAHAQLLSPDIEKILHEPSTTKQSDREIKKRIRQDEKEEGGKRALFILTPGMQDKDGAVLLRKQTLPSRMATDEGTESSSSKNHKRGITRYMRRNRKGD